jgi:hypothetical protein
MPDSRRSPGLRKNEQLALAQLLLAEAQLLRRLVTIGSRTTQYWRLVSVVSDTSPTTFSCTSGMCVGAWSIVTSHSSPAARRLPNASLNVASALRCTAFLSVSTCACTTPSTSSCTSGRNAPVERHSHSSPASWRWLARSTNARRARSLSAEFSCTMIDLTTSTTCTATLGMYVPGPLNIHSSPATRFTSSSAMSRIARSRSAQSAETTCSGTMPAADSFSPGYSGNGSCAKRISSSPWRSSASPEGPNTTPTALRITGSDTVAK